jgi:hypothetical protein
MIKGEIEATSTEGGATFYASSDYPPLPEQELRETAERVRRRLTS